MDKEFKIVDFTEGEGKFKGCVIWICDIGNGKTCRVTPKGTLKQKQEWFKNADKYIGQEITVKFQGYTKEGSLDFPVGLGFRLPQDT